MTKLMDYWSNLEKKHVRDLTIVGLFLKGHGSYNFRQTKFKDFSRTFQGQKLVFKDQGLFNKSSFFASFFPPKTLIQNPFQFLNSLCSNIL